MTFRGGPVSDLCKPLIFSRIQGGEKLPESMAAIQEKAARGAEAAWGIPFRIGKRIAVRNEQALLGWKGIKSPWLIFRHSADLPRLPEDASGFIRPMKGAGALGDLAAVYVLLYADGEKIEVPIRRRFQVGSFTRGWGENCFEAVSAGKPFAVPAHHEKQNSQWGWSQTRATANDGGPWVDWLWAWKNPRPGKALAGLRILPGESGTLVLAAVSAGWVEEHPLRWGRRRKALLRVKDKKAEALGLFEKLKLDLGQVISVQPRPLYPGSNWGSTDNNDLPARSEGEFLVEYSAHPQARFHLAGKKMKAPSPGAQSEFRVLPPALQRVRLRVVDRTSGRPLAVKLHVHGVAGEYLPPVHRHRIPNPAWFEDYSTDFLHRPSPLWTPEKPGPRKLDHLCSYVDGDVDLDLPLGRVYVEVSKGFEVKPVRKVLRVGPETKNLKIAMDKVLPWREKGWVTADTHVHFLSPQTGVLEGSAEGVNVINLLASQWGELMTNVGDFDGKTTWGSKEAGGDGEWLVRVGTENRQHVLGHISLIGYEGRMIAPMTTGGPDESALGDPVEILLTEWARLCREQKGVVVLPHFPNPRAEHAATLVMGLVDGIEMTSWGHLYNGISAYSLSDWYRYLNCGYLVPVVGGTDKMSADTPVGAVRTYARIEKGRPFTFENWKRALRRAETFVSYGPLMEFKVEGRPPGSRLSLGPQGGTVDVAWEAASVTMPMTRLELVVNGEIRESRALDSWKDRGSFRLPLRRSSWAAILIRGQYPGKPEVIAAHSSPVMVEVRGSPFFAAADAVTILEQIEGAMSYLDTLGTRPEARRLKEMKLVLTSAHRRLHNRLHEAGFVHRHAGAGPLSHKH